jgi:hypothetical protein
MTNGKPLAARRLLLPNVLLAVASLASLAPVTSCVSRADLKAVAVPVPTSGVGAQNGLQNENIASLAPLPTLPPTATLAPLSAPASPALEARSEPQEDADSTFEPVAFTSNLSGLSPKLLRAALDAVSCARTRGVSGRRDLLTVIDYSRPSTEPRLWVLDLKRGKVLFHELVAHGAGSGDNYATQFSNTMDSRQTSLGLFLTEGTYEGGNGYSLRLRGLDAGVNDLAEERNIVMHGAWYVSAQHAREHGRLGRSWGCPALPVEEARPVIDAVKGGSFVFAYAGNTGSAGSQGAIFASAGARCKGSRPASARTARTARGAQAVVEAKAAALASITGLGKTSQP